uniref:Peptidase M14 domain-containing protein n=1 Tax=Anopheles dirus TaxID=7168 RepID=A0A182N1B4_9DIPT
MVREIHAVRGIYVNNHRIEKFETDAVQLSHPSGTGTAGSSANGHGLLTKDNFTSPQQYYQYLVGEDPVHYIDLLWGKNKTQLPSIFRIGSVPAAATPTPASTTVTYADDPSAIKNTLNNTNLAYRGDYPQPHELQSTVSTLLPPLSTTNKPSRKRKKKPAKPAGAGGANKTALTPETVSLLSRYYSFSCTLTPLQSGSPTQPTAAASTTHRTKTRLLTTTTKRPKVSPAPGRQKKPVVYVDPPVIKRIGGVLESVYKFMENALTSTEYVDESDEIRAVKSTATLSVGEKRPVRAKVKRNTYTQVSAGAPGDDLRESPLAGTEQTWLPVANDATPKLVTISGLPATLTSDGSKNKMTTNIQVTSEYTAATPPTVAKPRPDSSGDDSSEEDSDEDYFDGFGGFAGEEEDDDEEDEEEDDDEDEDDTDGSDESVRPTRQTALSNDKDYEEVAAHVELPVRIKRVKKRRRKQRPAASYEDTAEYSDEDGSDESDESDYDDRGESIEADDDDDEDDEPDAVPEGFFSRVFHTFGRLVRSLGFGGAARGTPEDYSGRSTTPRVHPTVRRRRPTRSTSDQLDWIDLANDLEQEEPPLPGAQVLPTIPTTSSWFELMMPWDFFNPWEADGEQELAASTTQPPEQEVTPGATATPVVAGWLSQLFGSPTTAATTTTKLPPTRAPEQLLAALAQYVAQSATTRRPTAPTGTSQPVSYAGYQLWRIRVPTEDHLRRLHAYRQSPDGLRLQWWTSPDLLRPTDVLVPPGAPADALRDYLDEEGLRHEPTIRDLGRAIAYENPRLTRREQMDLELQHGHPLTWHRYHRYADIVKYVHHLQRRHPQRVQLLHIGRSYEGRPVTVVRVTHANQTARGKRSKRRPAVFVEAGAHGHQWVGPAVATWLLSRLVAEEASADSVLQTHDWYVLPVLNPDGYEYSHRHDRMWSKNRAQTAAPPATGVGQALLTSALNWWHAQGNRSDGPCLGVDLNRNWAYGWQRAAEPARRTPCSDTYAGPEPFSEPEVRALRDFLLTRRRNVRLYLSLQAYGQQLSYPDLQQEGDAPTAAFGDVHEMAAAGLEAMRAEAGEFLYSLEPDTGPAGDGTSAGYARHGAGIRYSYTLHLPDTGTHGFLLPPSNIVPIGRDTFELLKGMVEYS